MKATILLTIAGLWSGFLAAQPQPVQWHHLDPETDSVMGISTERAYRELLRGRKATPVMVTGLTMATNSTAARAWLRRWWEVSRPC